MENITFTENDVLAITSALEIHLEELQVSLKYSSKKDKIKVSESINWAKEAIKLFSMQQPMKGKHILIAITALEALLEMPVENNNSKEIRETLSMQTLALSALNKLESLINSVNIQD